MEGSKPYSLTACLCLFKGDSEGHDVFQVQLIKESIQENQHHLVSFWGHSWMFSSQFTLHNTSVLLCSHTVCTAMSISPTCDYVARACSKCTIIVQSCDHSIL